MPRPRTPLIDRVLSKARREASHLIWDGEMRGRTPHLSRVGHPARVFLQLAQHPDYQIRRDQRVCDAPRCIEPSHFHVIQEKCFKYSDMPNTPWRDPRQGGNGGFTDREIEEIVEAVERLGRGDLATKDLDFYPARLKLEILSRTRIAP
jgi:hypothetical protein